ncbi:MAG: hypothetical protein GWM90_03310, partial [Gemmatimonadetes bacterium]|nr:hypothetical protein [Gemmatimonadota bacterium]NIU72794.1 hypothetical protein [Gammaproteobacteria bacterium]NIX43183.1 hypothetical protein [Gemmatimonadota bacterium]
EGDYARAGAMLEEYGVMRPEIEAAVDRLETVPVDIRPRYEVRGLIPEWNAIAERLSENED